MNIKLKFFGLGIKDIMQAHVTIKNNNKVVFDGYTYNGEVDICLNKYCAYKLYAYSFGEEITINFYVDGRCNYYFYFPRSILNRIITFRLIDLNYNMMIERGNLILWEK